MMILTPENAEAAIDMARQELGTLFGYLKENQEVRLSTVCMDVCIYLYLYLHLYLYLYLYICVCVWARSCREGLDVCSNCPVLT
jgi:hypothetical protein